MKKKNALILGGKDLGSQHSHHPKVKQPGDLFLGQNRLKSQNHRIHVVLKLSVGAELPRKNRLLIKIQKNQQVQKEQINQE